MKLSYKYRLYPNRLQREALDEQFELCRLLYNSALEERRSYYDKFNKGLNYGQQCLHLSEIKEIMPEFENVYSQTLQQTLKQLDIAYTNFFRRVASGTEAPGFPRFKSYGRFRSILFPQPAPDLDAHKGVSLHGKKLQVSKVPGEINVKLHRRLPEGARCKNVRIVRENDRYFVVFSMDGVQKDTIPSTGKSAGFDLGITTFIVENNRSAILHPRPLKRAKDKLIKAQRNLAAKKRGSNNSMRARLRLARTHQKIVNIRDDFSHKTALRLLRENDTVIFEKLDIVSMMKDHTQIILPNGFAIPRNGLHNSISDVSWGKFCQIVAYKAEKADKRAIFVDPKGTTKTCSSCGEEKDMPLDERAYHCEHCGAVFDRDHNAARNIYWLGMSLEYAPARAPKQKPPPRRSGRRK